MARRLLFDGGLVELGLVPLEGQAGGTVTIFVSALADDDEFGPVQARTLISVVFAGFGA
jgi:hypothetical protein